MISSRISMLSRTLLAFALLFTLQIIQASPITHTPVASFASGQRIQIDVKIRSESGVELARVYFKGTAVKDYHFVPMMDYGAGYFATLPAPSSFAKEIKYVVLFKGKDGSLIKSAPYRVPVISGKSEASFELPLAVYTELAKATDKIEGFNDNLTMDTVESGAKYGIVSGLYDNGSIDTDTDADTDSTDTDVDTNRGTAESTTPSTGTSAATTAATGISGTTIGLAVGGVVAVAAVVTSDDGDAEDTPLSTDINGEYRIDMLGAISENITGDCFNGAGLRFSAVPITVDGTTLTLNLGAGSMTGSYSENIASINSGEMAIEPGSQGFNSTDALSWTDFTLSWSDANNFTSSSFELSTNEIGVTECRYTTTLTGSK